MSNPSIYSKTRLQLRRDLAAARDRPATMVEPASVPEPMDTGAPEPDAFVGDHDEEAR